MQYALYDIIITTLCVNVINVIEINIIKLIKFPKNVINFYNQHVIAVSNSKLSTFLTLVVNFKFLPIRTRL